jgi:thioredoxin reductase (NADPH)
LGQLALTTEVENYPGFPAGDLEKLLGDALTADRAEPLLYAMRRRREQMKEHAHKEAVTGPELMELMRQQALNFGTRIKTDDIVDVDFNRHPFRLTSLGGETVEALAVIIATGARANYLGLPSEEKYKNRGVSACAVCDGALPRFRNKPLVVIGGGDSAVEESTYLTKFASKVHLVHRRDELRASRIMAERAKNNPKIEIVWNHELQEVHGNDKEGVTGVQLTSTVGGGSHQREASGVFLAIGHTPNTQFLEGKLELTAKRYIKWTVPFRTNTSVEGVFAAGDVADDYYRQAVTAAGSGCMAAIDVERWLNAKGFH